MGMANIHEDRLVLEKATFEEEQSQGVSQELNTVDNEGDKAPDLELFSSANGSIALWSLLYLSIQTSPLCAAVP